MDAQALQAPALSAGELFEVSAARSIEWIDLGVEDYAKTYDRQREAVALAKADSTAPDRVFMVEHPAIYTKGRRSSEPVDPSLPCIAIERGGETTFHNPGQLVCYPILRLVGAERDLHAYLRKLETVLINVLADFELHGERRPGATGVWLAGKEKKIASIGVAVSSWITFHGVALNVDNDLSGFSKISPCGFSAEVMTSLQAELGPRCPGMDSVKSRFVTRFGLVFSKGS